MSIKGVMLCGKEGSLLFYRNYSQLNHSDFEDLSYQLGGGDSRRGQTYFQHLQERVVFLPLDNLFLAVVTDSRSNIIQDQKTLTQCKTVLTTCLDEITEEAVEDSFIELAFGFDDLISLGAANELSPTDLEDSLRMESSNELVHNQMILDKEKEQQRKAEEECREIERSNRVKEILEQERKQIEEQIGVMVGSSQDQLDSEDYAPQGAMGVENSQGAVEAITREVEADYELPKESSGGLASGILGKKDVRKVRRKRGGGKKKGLKLGKRKRGKGKVKPSFIN